MMWPSLHPLLIEIATREGDLEAVEGLQAMPALPFILGAAFCHPAGDFGLARAGDAFHAA